MFESKFDFSFVTQAPISYLVLKFCVVSRCLQRINMCLVSKVIQNISAAIWPRLDWHHSLCCALLIFSFVCWCLCWNICMNGLLYFHSFFQMWVVDGKLFRFSMLLCFFVVFSVVFLSPFSHQLFSPNGFYLQFRPNTMDFKLCLHLQ